MSWKALAGSPVVEYKSFSTSKVGHVVAIELGGQGGTWTVFKAFWDGNLLGTHDHAEAARLAIELVSGDHERPAR